ncbi:MAG: O-antigen ligase family protein [Bryobacteraceae bacterium]|nr:O-antigen ligase family protein [Bryobacteraceae bacterium]
MQSVSAGLVYLSLATAILLGAFVAVGVNATVGLLLGVVLTIAILLRPILGLALTVVTNVMSPLLGSFDFSGLGLTLPRVTGAITVLSWFLWLVWRREKIPFPPHLVPLAAFLGAIAFSLATKPDRMQSIIGAYLVMVGVVLYLLMGSLPNRKADLLLVVAVVWSMGLVSSAIGLVQYVAPQFTILQNTEGGLDVGEGAVVDEDSVSSGPIKRVTGGLGDANQFAYTLVSIMPLGMFWWRRQESQNLRWLVILVVIVQLGGLALSYSRSGFIALACSVLFLTWKRHLPVSLVLPGALAACLAALVILPGFAERIFSVSYLKEGSTQIRKDILADTLAIIRENWVTGIGYGELGPRIYGQPRSGYAQEMADQIDLESPEIHNTGAHNLVLEVWVEYGIVGLIPYLAFLILLILEVDRLSRSTDPFTSDLATALLAGIVAFLVCGMFGHAKSLKVFWLLAGMAVALRYARWRVESPLEIEAPPALVTRS